jgi:hypothetical protein
MQLACSITLPKEYISLFVVGEYDISGSLRSSGAVHRIAPGRWDDGAIEDPPSSPPMTVESPKSTRHAMPSVLIKTLLYKPSNSDTIARKNDSLTPVRSPWISGNECTWRYQSKMIKVNFEENVTHNNLDQLRYREAVMIE